jgi:hypothetical protein
LQGRELGNLLYSPPRKRVLGYVPQPSNQGKRTKKPQEKELRFFVPGKCAMYPESAGFFHIYPQFIHRNKIPFIGKSL